MSIYVIFVLSSGGIKPGSRCSAMTVSTYSTIHNVGPYETDGPEHSLYSERHKAFDKVVRTLSGHNRRLG